MDRHLRRFALFLTLVMVSSFKPTLPALSSQQADFAAEESAVMLPVLIQGTSVTAPSESRLIFSPLGDAHVKEEQANKNYSSDDSLRIRNADRGDYEVYLKFDLSSLSGNVQQATLRLYAIDGGPNAGTVYAAGDNWQEDDLTWDNRPAPISSELDIQGETEDDTWVEYDVTAAINANVSAFIVRGLSHNSIVFHSREASTNRPELILQIGEGESPPGDMPPPDIPPTETIPPTDTPPPDGTPTPTETVTPTPPPTITPTPAATTPSPTPTESPTPAPSNTPPPPGASGGIWLSAEEINDLPTSGAAWNNVLKWANESITPDISEPNNDGDAVAVAAAFVCIRTGQTSYCDKARSYVMDAIGTEDGGLTLALGRNLAGYVIAADLVGLADNNDAAFRTWLDDVRTERFDDRTLISTHNERPNNWGTHAGVSRIAAALYLGDGAELAQAAAVFHGWLGNREAYAGFGWRSDMSWHCNPSQPVPVNPAGCTIDGHPADGILPDDQRRGGSFSWPPTKENYVWEALQGAVAQAWMLHRAGYPAFEWEQGAPLRAVTWLHEQADFSAEQDDTGTPWLINAIYGTSFPTRSANPGKNGLGFYDWTHGN